MDDRTRKIAIVPFLVVLFAVTAGLLAYNAYQVVSENPEVGRALGTGVKVRTAKVISRKYLDSFGATGDASPSRTLSLRKAGGAASQLTQRVDDIMVEVGDLVKDGDLLVKFDIGALDSQAEADKENQSALQRDLNEFETRARYRREEVQAAVRTAQANVQSARSTLARDEANLERTKRLGDAGLVSRFDLERAQSARDLSEFNVRQAEEEAINKQNDLADLKTRLASERETLKSNVSEAHSQVETARGNMENAYLKAPWDGLVMERQVEPGEWVLQGEGILKLGQIDPIWVLARVPQEMVHRVFDGQQGEVVFDALPYDNFQASVINVDPAIDKGSATFKATLSVPNPSRRIRPGMSGFVHFRNERIALVIPQMAVTGSGSDTAVFVADKGVAKLRHVKIGEVVEVGFLEVLGGLREGEEVVIYGLKDLQDGDPVRTVED